MKNFVMALGSSFSKPTDYQYHRFPEDQYQLISSTESYRSASSTLEVGCNAGMLVQKFQNDEKFSVGLEQIVPHRVVGAVLAGFRLDLENVARLPHFDLVLALSVHHQWIAAHGNEYAGKLVKMLYEKALKGLFLEFAARNAKYGEQPGTLFQDNDEISVRDYALDWLTNLGFSGDNIRYLGATRESPPVEPHRYIYELVRP